jgi:hypothetical protein
MRYNLGMELNFLFPKIVVTLVIVAWAMLVGYRLARRISETPTLGDTLIWAMKGSPWLLTLGVGFVWML